MTNKQAILQLQNLREHCNSFRAIEGIWEDDMEALDLAIKALEKQTPKKPKVGHRQYFCPECESKLIAYNWTGGIHFCHHCGQAIDWNNEKEML